MHGARNPTSLDMHFYTVRLAMQSVFSHLGLAA
jgi:hypothetical protein